MTSERISQTRRQFLRQQVAPVALVALGVRSLKAPASAEPEQPAQGDLVSLSCMAMACRWEIMLPADDEDALPAAQAALELVADLERQMSVFREDSEISDINRRAADGPVAVEPRLFGLLEFAARVARETEGAFDITAGALAHLWRRCRTEGRVPSADEVERARIAAGMSDVRLDPERRTIEFTRPGLALDLGAIGKGHALDCVAESLRGARVTSALVHAGHSSIAAIGSPPWEGAWSVSVADPNRGDHPAARLRLRDRFMATSGSTEQSFEADGTSYGHVIDPRTGWPAEGMLGATVIAPTAAEADALSTAFYTMGADAARAYCAIHPQVSALMIAADGAAGKSHVLSIGIENDVLEVTV
jgi:thiamine biosynthesis lipoprotein